MKRDGMNFHSVRANYKACIEGAIWQVRTRYGNKLIVDDCNGGDNLYAADGRIFRIENGRVYLATRRWK